MRTCLYCASTSRARWRRRRDDAAADPAPAADDARPWPRFARCAVLLDGEWRRGAVTSRRPGFLLVALDGARPGAPAVAASYDQVLRLPDAHEAPGAAAAPAAAKPTSDSDSAESSTPFDAAVIAAVQAASTARKWRDQRWCRFWRFYMHDVPSKDSLVCSNW